MAPAAPTRQIGTEEDAARALRGDMPVIGGGGHRTVHRDPDGDTVYKVENEQGRRDRTNSHEHANADLFSGYYGVPPTTLYSIDGQLVLAMPFYPHAMRDWTGTADMRASLEAHFGDFNLPNMRRDGADRVWFVDLATRRRVPMDDPVR